MNRHDAISRLLSPRSIAIIGASADATKISGRPLKHLRDKGYRGAILPVNPGRREIAGLPCLDRIEALPEGVDLAVVTVPAEAVIATVSALGARGVAAAVVFSSGFGEMGEAGLALERRLAEQARLSKVALCGPNCLGFVNAFDSVYATFSQYADGPTGAGPIAFVTQSGAFGTAIAALARQRGLGLGYFINTGNEADLTFSELASAVAEDPRIKVVAGYLEGLTDGTALVALAEQCARLGKPLVLTKVGRLASGARAAASHTGALAVEDAVFDAVIRQYGVRRARNEEQMLDMLEAFCQDRRASGNGLGIATQSGGAGVMMADRAEEVGLAVPLLTEETRKRLAAVMPAFGAAGNPVDITGQFVARPELLRESVVALLDDPGIHVGIIWLQLMTAHVETLVALFGEIQSRTAKPFLVCWVAAPSQALERLRALGIAVYPAGERAVEAAAALVAHGEFLDRIHATPSPRASSPPDALPQPGAGGWRTGVQPTVQAGEWLRAAGVPIAPAALATSADEAVAHWRAFASAVALKIESPDIAHKTEVEGVLLGLDEESSIRSGYEALLARGRSARPGADLHGVVVQPMVKGHVELVVGAFRDPVFGMMVMVGLGGILVEVLKDVAFRRAPFDFDEASRMLAELRASALLDGVRGRPPCDRAAIATILARVSAWAHSMQSLLEELDLNPVLVGEQGPIAVDCVMVLRQDQETVVGVAPMESDESPINGRR